MLTKLQETKMNGHGNEDRIGSPDSSCGSEYVHA